MKFPEKQLQDLEAFVLLLKSRPQVLHQPELAFLKNYLESLDAKLPPAESSSSGPEPPKQCPFSEGKKAEPSKPEPQPEEEMMESDVELDNSGVIGKRDLILITT